MPISRFADPGLPGGGLTTSIVSVVTDTRRNGSQVVGYGFGSFGRYAQSGLLRERFAPRLLAAEGELDPMRAWDVMMTGEKPGGHVSPASYRSCVSPTAMQGRRSRTRRPPRDRRHGFARRRRSRR